MDNSKEIVAEASAVIGRTAYQTTVTSAAHSLIIDEPVDIGGADTGVSPYGLLMGSLASCTAITLRMYINRKMWIIDEISVVVEMRKTGDGMFIDSKLSFKGDVTEEQLKRLITIADACPVHKILVGNVKINTSLA